MGLINLLAERVGVINTSPRIPQESGIILWDEPEPPTTGGEIPYGPYEPRGTEGEWDGPVGAGPRRGDLPISGGGHDGGGRTKYYPDGFSGRIPLMDPYVPLFPDAGGALHGSGSGATGGGNVGGDSNTNSGYFPQVDPPTNPKSRFKIKFVPYLTTGGSKIVASDKQKQLIIDAVDDIINNFGILSTLREVGLGDDYLELFKGLRVTLGSNEDYPCDRSNNAVAVTHDKEGNPLPEPYIILCPRFFEGRSTDEAQNSSERAGILLHEILHLLGGTELDSELTQYLVGMPSSQYPFLDWRKLSDPAASESEKKDALEYWCRIKYGKAIAPKYEEIKSELHLVGKMYTLNLDTGEVWFNGKKDPSYNTSFKEIMPPVEFFRSTRPEDGCPEDKRKD